MYNQNYQNQRYTPYQNNDNGYRGNQRSPYSQQYQQRQVPKKHSGAKLVMITKGDYKGQHGISAWNYSKQRGMLSIFCAPYSKTHEVTSERGRKWQNWMVKVKNMRTFQESIHGGMYDPTTNKIVVNDLGFVINPKAANGGYCGTFIKK